MSPQKVAERLARLAIGPRRGSPQHELASIARSAQLEVNEAIRRDDFVPPDVILAVVEQDTIGHFIGVNIIKRFRDVVGMYRQQRFVEVNGYSFDEYD